MANMTAATDEQMNSRLKKDYDAKKNNLTQYYYIPEQYNQYYLDIYYLLH